MKLLVIIFIFIYMLQVISITNILIFTYLDEDRVKNMKTRKESSVHKSQEQLPELERGTSMYQ